MKSKTNLPYLSLQFFNYIIDEETLTKDQNLVSRFNKTDLIYAYGICFHPLIVNFCIKYRSKMKNGLVSHFYELGLSQKSGIAITSLEKQIYYDLKKVFNSETILSLYSELDQIKEKFNFDINQWVNSIISAILYHKFFVVRVQSVLYIAADIDHYFGTVQYTLSSGEACLSIKNDLSLNELMSYLKENWLNIKEDLKRLPKLLLSSVDIDEFSIGLFAYHQRFNRNMSWSKIDKIYLQQVDQLSIFCSNFEQYLTEKDKKELNLRLSKYYDTDKLSLQRKSEKTKTYLLEFASFSTQ